MIVSVVCPMNSTSTAKPRNNKNNNKKKEKDKMSLIMDEIDFICGTKPPGHWPPRREGLRDLLISAEIHQLAAQLSDAKAREQLQSAAANIYTAAGKVVVG